MSAVRSRSKRWSSSLRSRFPGNIRPYGERLRRHVEEGKAYGEFSAEIGTEAVITLFTGTIQGVVMQSWLADDVERIRRDAPGVLAIYLRGIGSRK